MPYDVCVHQKNRALEMCGLCERERAERAEQDRDRWKEEYQDLCPIATSWEERAVKAEADLGGWRREATQNLKDNIALSAQVVTLRGALECGTECACEDPEFNEPGIDCPFCEKRAAALSLTVPPLVAAVQGCIETVRLISGPIEFYCAVGERSMQAAAQAAISRLDAAMGKK